MRVNITPGLPPAAHGGELVAVDLEVFGIPNGKVHRPVGTFACASVYMETSENFLPECPEVYQIYDPHDLPALMERLRGARLVFQNGRFDIRQMRRWCEVEPRKIWDTMIVEQGLFGGYYSTFDLASLSLRYLKQPLDKAVREEFATATEMTPEMKRYAALDPVVTLRVAREQMRYVEENDVSLTHYWKADHPALWAILDMPPARMDVEGWNNLSGEFEAKANAIQARYIVNLGSPKQVNDTLCKMMGRKEPYRSTDEEHLLEVKDRALHAGKDMAAQFIDDVLEFRGYAKMHGTYGAKWLEKYIENGEWVWADFKPVQAITGRLACAEPNLTNIPAREHPIFRTFFKASDGNVLLVADVASQEPRITAKLSGDKRLLKILRDGISPHVGTGMELFEDPDFSKAHPLYKLAKAINLGLSYGMTADGLAKKAGIPLEEAAKHLQAYFRTFSGVKAYIDSYRKKASRQGYVETLLGRRSWINPYTRKWENNAINSPVQGSAADQLKIAMGYLHRESRARGLPFCLTMVVHDEMVCDVPEEIEPEYRQLIEDAWQEAGRLTLGDTVPMVLEMASGENWSCKK